MILDFEHELTTAAGQLFNAAEDATEYGTIPLDLGKTVPEDPVLSGEMDLYFKVHSGNVNVTTSYEISLITSADGGASGAAVVIPVKTVLVANMTEGTLHFIGTMKKHQTMQRYLNVAVTTKGGTAATTGLCKAWLVPAGSSPPAVALT